MLFRSLRVLFYALTSMRIPLPNKRVLRLCESVETVNPQYQIYDFGVEHADGGIDSIAAGGSFHTAKSALRAWQANCEKETADKADATSQETAQVA